MNEHHYHMTLTWTGNVGQGTKEYSGYERSLVISCEGKPDLLGSADPVFRGDPTKYNPEELLLAAVSSCHMLSYLHLCADNKIVVTQYKDQPTATMKIEKGVGKFTEAVLNPVIFITDAAQVELAEKLHHKAHEICFIANSVNFPIHMRPTIQVEVIPK